MVRSRLVDSPDSSDPEDMVESMELPDRYFADGEEPIGIRVLPYHSSNGIRSVLAALSEDEITFLKASTFGKFIETAEKPAFSGRFVRYILSKQLKVKKKHEAWFRFAGNPIRFSLREFAIVTGLPCGKFPKQQRKPKKDLMAQTPYWPSLFGSAETVTVSSVIRMLRKKTVVDKEVRIKYACLALVSSVLMPTSLKSKISKEYTELIKDLDEFFAYPWGRLAFDMLMAGIKEKDEISLSQNTFALKGFVHALQLVMVEAVPALTEVVQDAASSSESESDRDDDDIRVKHGKRVTLSPGHARDVDQKCEVPVNCVLVADLANPIDESTVEYSDEEKETKVDNILRLLSEDHRFNNAMFKGGASRADIERKKSNLKGKGKKMKSCKYPVSAQTKDNSKIAADVYEKMKPDITKIEEKILHIKKSVKEVSLAVAAMESSVGNILEENIKSMIETQMGPMLDSKLCQFKGDIQEFIENLLQRATGESIIRPSIPKPTSFASPTTNSGNFGRDNDFVEDDDFSANGENNCSDRNDPGISDLNKVPDSESHKAQSTDDVLGPSAANPLNKPDINTPEAGTCASKVLTSDSPIRTEPSSANNKVDSQSSLRPNKVSAHETDLLVKSRTRAQEMYEMALFPVSEIPSFSLGLSQEETTSVPDSISDDEPSTLNKDDPVDTPHRRKSKRQKTVPHGLVDVFQCTPDILSRAREGQMAVFGKSDALKYTEKYTKLSQKLNSQFEISFGGCFLSNKDILDIAERPRLYSSKVMDVLMRHVAMVYEKQSRVATSKQSVFYDTKFVAAISKNYTRFSKLEEKETYNFGKNLLDTFGNKVSHHPEEYRFYFPFNLDKKHWIGLCVDGSAWTITVLDCNIAQRSEASMVSELKPISEMFPYLMKQAGLRVSNSHLRPLTVERAKGVSQNSKPADSSLTSVLLMQTHALFGMEACGCIEPHMLASEAQKVAVILYEYHMKL